MTGSVAALEGTGAMDGRRWARLLAGALLLVVVAATTAEGLAATAGMSPSRAGALLGALGAGLATACAAWTDRERRPRAASGLLVLVGTSWAPLVAAALAVPSWLEVALVALWGLTPVALVLVAAGWLAPARRDLAVAATPAVVAFVLTVALYAPVHDPGCTWRCGDGASGWAGDVSAGAVAAVATALTAASAGAVGRWVVVHRRRVPAAVVTGVGVALAAVLALCLVRVTGWGLTAGPPARSWWLTTPAATAAAGVAVLAWSTARVRARVRRLAVRLGGLDEVGPGDDGTVVHFALRDGTGWVDAEGRSVEEEPGLRRSVVVRDEAGMPWARLVAPRRRRSLVAGTGDTTGRWHSARWLLLENARATALSRADRREVEASRRRVVEASDLERRRIERDLHDGVQQRLVSAKLHLALARRRSPEAATPPLLEAERRAQTALEGLRVVAHGLFPRMLQTEGLVPALEDLAGQRAVGLDCEGQIPQLPLDVRTAAYAVVRRLTEPDGSGPSGARVNVSASGAVLSVRVTLPGSTRENAGVALVELEDRVGALGGVLRAEDDRGGLLVEAVLPCGS